MCLDGGGPAGTGALVRALDESERLREIMSVYVCLRVLGGLSGAGFAGFVGIFRMAGVPPALVRSDERWTRVCERLRVFTRDWYGRPLWVDHEMGRISCIQTDAGCFEQSTKFSRLVFDGRALDATGRSRIPAECAAFPVGWVSDLFSVSGHLYPGWVRIFGGMLRQPCDDISGCGDYVQFSVAITLRGEHNLTAVGRP